MKIHWRRDGIIGLKALVMVLLLYYFPIYLWKGVVRTVYEDHRSLVAQNARLSADNANLKNENLRLSNTDFGGQLAQKQMEIQAERDNAQRWREAYEGITRGDLHPDRHLDSEDKRRLRETLRVIAKEPRNKDYIKLDFGMNTNPETQHIAWQLYMIFRDSHWNVPAKIKTELPKALADQLQMYGGPNWASGIFIFTDDPQNRGQYLSGILNSCCGLQALVNPRGIPPNFKGTMLWIGNKQFTNWKNDD